MAASLADLGAQVTALLIAGLPGLMVGDAETVLIEANAADGHPLRRLHRFLTAHTDAFTIATADPPAVFVRLAQVLHEHGYPAVPLPGCAGCGRSDRRLNRRDGDGRRVCPACYRPPLRPCGRCGRLRPVARRGSGEQPDLCSGCHQGTEATCSICGRTRATHRAADGLLRCQACIPRTPRRCAECGHSAPVKADWPIGPVCSACYTRVRADPADCPACRHRRPLIGVDLTGSRVCGPCAGTSNDHACRVCGEAGDLYADRRCARCVLAERLQTLLPPGSTHHHGLLPVIAALGGSPKPRSMIRWLATSPGPRLLAQLATEPEPITHELLDNMPRSVTVHHVRSLLVETGVLPARVEYLDRIGPWLEQFLQDAPAEHARLVRQFTHWWLLRRARSRRRARPFTPHAAAGIRLRVTIALSFLTHLRSYGLTLADARQEHVDRWLTDGPPARRTLRPFLLWATQRDLVNSVGVEAAAVPAPSNLQDDHQQWQQLRRCLHDETMPLQPRVAGALILLFGSPITRLTAITLGQIEQRDGQTHLTLGRHRLLVPPVLARLLIRQRDDAATRWALTTTRSTDRPLFPGLHGRPANPAALRNSLSRHGIRPQAARNTALAALAGDLPPVVLTELLDLGITTAIRWANHARRDWAPYLAERHHEHADAADPDTTNVRPRTRRVQ